PQGQLGRFGDDGTIDTAGKGDHYPAVRRDGGDELIAFVEHAFRCRLRRRVGCRIDCACSGHNSIVLPTGWGGPTSRSPGRTTPPRRKFRPTPSGASKNPPP